MEKKQDGSICEHCGYRSDGSFVGDICPQCGLAYWECSECRFLVTTAVPPDICPECGAKCAYINVTCYLPECGGQSHYDPRLIKIDHTISKH